MLNIMKSASGGTKILKSLLVLALVAGSVYGIAQSGAWFTDTEILGDNSISTGTIDIKVDETSNTQFNLVDMKPSQVDYLDYIINNVGSNPANIFKVLYNPVNSDPEVSEPECVAENGTWDKNAVSPTPKCGGNRNATANLGSQIRYDMRVELYDPDISNENPVWWETIYMDEDDVRLSALWNDRMYLGMIPVGWHMKVMQSYHT
ncbi:M73 family metallopeptidase [Patescibacteria group bacterium]|nr:M73 family metallopeptidase [Patescibacteria group bacterium]